MLHSKDSKATPPPLKYSHKVYRLLRQLTETLIQIVLSIKESLLVHKNFQRHQLQAQLDPGAQRMASGISLSPPLSPAFLCPSFTLRWSLLLMKGKAGIQQLQAYNLPDWQPHHKVSSWPPNFCYSPGTRSHWASLDHMLIS